MSETNSEQEPADSVETSRPGTFKVVLATVVFCATAVLLSLFAIDQMDMGREILRKFGFVKVTGSKSAPARAAKAEVKIVEKIVKVEVPVEKIVEKIVEVEVIPPMPSSYIPWQKIDTAKLWSGVQIANTVVEDTPGEAASLERSKEDAIQLETKLRFKIPAPSQSMAQLAQLNSHLPKMLPGLASLIDQGKVSPFYHHLYERKTQRLQEKVTRLDQLLSVHNFYDTETVLELGDPGTGHHVLLIQSDMDVVSDGSDGDRWPFLDNYVSMSNSYQPFTSYGWAKRSRRPNPLLGRWQANLKKYKERYSIVGLSLAENRFLEAQIETLPREIEDLKARSYLIAEADPFIVMSLAFLGRREETKFGPMIGDYAVVIHGDKLYPTIVGDAGPTFKFGEASLRMARQINPKASPYSRPVSDLLITYLVFPGSREEKNSPPNLEAWRNKCQEYLDKTGGVGEGYSLHQWEDIIPVKLEEWKANHPGELIDPEAPPTPTFSNPVTPTPSPVEPVKEAEETTEVSE